MFLVSLCAVGVLWQCFAREVSLDSLLAKIEGWWNDDYHNFFSDHEYLAYFDYRGFWNDRFAGPLERTHFSKQARSNLFSLAQMLDKLQDILWREILKNCVDGCQPHFTCNIRTLSAGVVSATTTFTNNVNMLKFVGSRSIVEDILSYLDAIVLEFVTGRLVMSSSDCSDPQLNGGWMTKFLAAMNMYVNMKMYHLYAKLATQTVEVNKTKTRALVFDASGAECLSPLLCISKVELGKVLLSQVSAASEELLYVAEIGTYLGNWSLTMAHEVKNVIMLAVDPYDCKRDCYPLSHLAYDIVHANAAPLRDRFQLIRQTSINASKWVGDGILSLLFIDGEHSYEACSDDVRHWAPKVKAGGVILFHDFSLTYLPVMHCILESYDRLSVGPLYVSLDFTAYFFVK